MPISSEKSRKIRRPGEVELLNHIRRQVAAMRPAAVSLGIGDDCALIRPRPGEDLAVTTDLAVAGRHFRLDWHPPESVGHRTLARGLSDLAAMGARPLAAFLSLGLPRELAGSGKWNEAAGTAPWIDGFLGGFLALARAHQTPLAGGDLAETPLAVADIVLIGTVSRGRALLRSGAQPGDTVYVTGALGGAAAALARIAEIGAERRNRRGRLRIPKPMEAQLRPHLYPQPRLAQGQWLMRRGAASAGIDISDGLSTDLAHICDESGVAAELWAEALPVHAAATLEQALHGGEDYELLFTAPAAVRMPQAIAGIAVSAIGRIVPARKGRPRVALITGGVAQPLEARGWEHFA